MFLASFDVVTVVLPLLEDEHEDKVPEMHAKKALVFFFCDWWQLHCRAGKEVSEC
jgi:hypothetical protein